MMIIKTTFSRKIKISFLKLWYVNITLKVYNQVLIN